MKISHSNSDLPLILAAQDGSVADAKRALQDGANVNCTTVVDPYENVTPLMLASRNGHNRVVKVLIDADADVRKSTSCIVPGEPAKETALHWAIAAGNVAGCKMLVNAGGGVDAKSTRGTPLSYAIDSGSTAIVKLLLTSGANANLVAGNDCRSPLEWAAESGRADMVKVLLQNGAKPKPNRLSKKTPLMLACVSNQVKVARLLVQAKDPINARDINGWTPLMWAAWGNSGDCIQLLLKGGANPRANDKKGRTAIDLAHEVDSHEAIYYLERA